MPITRYKRGSCIHLTCSVYDVDDALTDPSGGVVVSVFDEEGNALLDEGVMSSSGTGLYYYDWQTDSNDAAGMCKMQCKATSGAKVSIEEDDSAFELYA